jgi:hypothetical protein
MVQTRLGECAQAQREPAPVHHADIFSLRYIRTGPFQ